MSVTVRSLNCTNCGGRTKIPHGEQEAVCLHCGHTVRLSQAVLEEQQRGRQYPTLTPLKLGMKAHYRGREYELTGRQVLEQRDEGEISRWEEWLLVSQDGDMLVLEYDEGKWKMGEPFVPKEPVGPEQAGAYACVGRIPVDNGTALVTDSGEYRIVHVEGEFPWLTSVGKTFRYVDAISGSRFYCVEWTPDEVEYYRGDFLDQRQILSMFGLQGAIHELDRREKVLRGRRGLGAVAMACSFVAGLAWIIGFGLGSTVPGGSGSADLGSVGEEGVRFGPIPLKAVGRVHKLEVDGHMSEQSVWVAAVIEDENEQELVSADRDMWDESGTDEDGRWHESDLHASTTFVIQKPGNYFVRLYAEPEPGRSAQGTSASFRLKQGAVHQPYLGWYALLMGMLGFGFLAAGSPAQVGRAWEAMKNASDD